MADIKIPKDDVKVLFVSKDGTTRDLTVQTPDVEIGKPEAEAQQVYTTNIPPLRMTFRMRLNRYWRLILSTVAIWRRNG